MSACEMKRCQRWQNIQDPDPRSFAAFAALAALHFPAHPSAIFRFTRH
jgi:hypothetical protein